MPDSERPLAAPVDLVQLAGRSRLRAVLLDCHLQGRQRRPGYKPAAGRATHGRLPTRIATAYHPYRLKTAQTATHSRVYTPGFAQLEDREIAEILSFVRSS